MVLAGKGVLGVFDNRGVIFCTLGMAISFGRSCQMHSGNLAEVTSWKW